MKQKFVKKYKFEYFFGERLLAFVEFPDWWSIRSIEDELFWAKTYHPIMFSGRGIIVRCHIKLFEWKHFVKNNRRRLVEFSIDEKNPEFVLIKTDKDATTIFNL